MTTTKTPEKLATHTPGPWKTDGHNITTCPSGIDIGIAKLYGAIGQPIEANARLIASAPELLEAGKALVRKLQERDNDAWQWDETTDLLSAIAKGIPPTGKEVKA